MKRILMIALETERWGPARLPQHLAEAGVEVAVFCSAQNPLSHSTYATRHYTLDGLTSSRNFAASFGKVMADWKPDLVIPCDEPVAAMLQYVLKKPARSRRHIDQASLAVLQRSIGHVDKLDAMILKHHTRCMAESLGVRVPKSVLVTSADEAAKVAAEVGFPVFLKKSFSWAGRGIAVCGNEAEAKAGFQSMHTITPWYKHLARRALGRAWYPVDTSIEVQKAVEGEAVMYNVAALDGKVLAGFFGGRMARSASNGPSTVVEIGENAECKQAVAKMVAAMGASGFIAFDFMICKQTGQAYLLECNPRPNQVCHLGYHIGVNLCAALAAALSNQPVASGQVTGEKVVALFPQAWLNDEQTALNSVRDLDLPLEDPKLMHFMLRRGHERGSSVVNLLAGLKARGVNLPNYTFG